MKPPLRLVHASDIHLDTDYYGGEENIASRDFGRDLMTRLLERTVSLSPDLFLLAGDLFDTNRASDDTVRWCMARLAELPFPVVMIPGNHDCMDGAGIYQRYDFAAIPNVSVLTHHTGETVTLDVPQVRVWGKGMVDHSPAFHPLADMPAVDPARWNIAMGHGIYVARGGDTHRSSPVSAEHIADSGYDYVALGHHHALLDVSENGTAAFYCGAPVPISRDDQGTFLLVELAQGEYPSVRIQTL